MRTKFTVPTIIAAIAVGIFFVSARPVSAQVLSHQQAKVDEALAKSDNSYSIPTNIVVVPVFPPSSDFQTKDSDWFRGIYYYMIANERRPGFTDIPFHYVLTQDGRIFRGNSGGEERKISIDGLGSNMVVIGYLAGRSDNAFDPRAKDALGELLLDIADRNSINLDHVSVATVRYTRDDTKQTVVLAKQDLFGLWNTSLKSVVDGIRSRYSPIPKSYAIAVSGVELTTDQVNPGDTIVGSLTAKNTGDFGIYFDSSSELLGTKKDGNSKFFLQDIWPSNSQFTLMVDGDSLLPGEEKRFNFKLFVPLYFGEQSELFQLQTIGGQKLDGTDFTLKLNIAQPSGQIVEVKASETGYWNVHSGPAPGSDNVIAKVSSGERYLVTGNSGNGWIKIKLSNGSEGWVSILAVSFL